MDFEKKIARINSICQNSELDFEVLLNKRKKLLLGGSFDSIYYYQFFILFTGVLPTLENTSLIPNAFKMRFLSLLSPDKTSISSKKSTILSYSNSSSEEIKHSDIFYYYPKKPLYTGIGIQNLDVQDYPLLNITSVIDECYKLTDYFTLI